MPNFDIFPLLMMTVAGTLSTILALYAWQQRKSTGMEAFIFMMFATAEWIFCSLGENLSLSSASKITWAKLSYIGITLLPPLWVFFTAQYTQHAAWLSLRRVAMFLIIPAITLGLVLTNEAHDLIWASIQPVSNLPGSYLIYTHGLAFWIHSIYGYILLAGGTVYQLQFAFRSSRLSRTQALIPVIAILFPWIANLLYLLNLNPWPGLDLTPIAFSFTGVVLSLGVFRYRILNLVPIARDALIERMNDSILVMNKEEQVVDMNPAAGRLIGCSPVEMIGKPVDVVLAGFPDLVRKYSRTFNALVEEKVDHDRWIEVSIFPVNDRRNQLGGRMVVLRDISERKRIEAELASQRLFFSQVMDGMATGVIVTDLDGRFVYANPACAELSGYPNEYLIGRRPWDITPFQDHKTLDEQHTLRSKGLNSSYETRLIKQDGTITPVLITAVPRFVDGKPAGTIATVIDLTERKQVEEVVRQRTAQLEVANQELEAFAYSVSHDLRSPLRALDGFSAVLLTSYSDKLDEQGRHYLERLRSASQRMGQLIEDLLGLSRVTRSTLNHQPVDLSALANDIASELQRQDPQRQVEFVIAEKMAAEADPHLLRIALQNLLDNAWKFTSKRETTHIEVGCMTIEDFRSQNVDWAIHLPQSAISNLQSTIYFVRDNGVGFDMAYADKLFVPFQRLHSTQEFPGTGIGLATVQRIVARHGGRAWAEAQVDKGSTFYFILGGS